MKHPMAEKPTGGHNLQRLNCLYCTIALTLICIVLVLYVTSQYRCCLVGFFSSPRTVSNSQRASCASSSRWAIARPELPAPKQLSTGIDLLGRQQKLLKASSNRQYRTNFAGLFRQTVYGYQLNILIFEFLEYCALLQLRARFRYGSRNEFAIL